jgi:membrane-anchored protein YejM (alkaline phosphatase superfamily)
MPQHYCQKSELIKMVDKISYLYSYKRLNIIKTILLNKKYLLLWKKTVNACQAQSLSQLSLISS